MKPVTTFTLPWPPSVNSIYVRRGRGYALSKRVASYRTAVAALCYQQHVRRWRDTRLALAVDAFPPDAKRRDLDNLLKSLLDALEDCAVLDDDVNVDRILIVRRDVCNEQMRGGTKGKVTVTIESLEEGDEPWETY